MYKYQWMLKTAMLLLLLAALSGCWGSSDDGVNSEDGDSSADGDENATDGDSTPDGDESGEPGQFTSAGGNGDSRYGGDAEAGEGEGEGEDEGDDDAGREIVEADIYKVIGDKLYVLNSYRGLAIIDIADPSKISIVGRLRFSGYPREMYVENGIAVVLLSSVYHEIDGNGVVSSEVVTVDVSDPTSPALIRRAILEGEIADTRQVGNVVYVVSSEQYWWNYCENSQEGYNQVEILSLNIEDPANVYVADRASFEGNGWSVYVSQNAIYVGTNTYWWSNEGEGPGFTYVDISDPDGQIVIRDRVETAGYIQDRFKMNENGNVFTVVSWEWENGMPTVVETFDVSNPDHIIRLDSETVIDNEQLYATNYDGERLYVVTYEVVDPLFVVDLSDPNQIAVLGNLEIPGWSTHLEPRGERLLAVGIDDQNSWRTKISLFDVADPANPAELSTVIVGTENSYNYSEANYDWKAFKIFENLEVPLILVPSRGYSDNWGKVTDQLNLVDWTDDKLTARGSVVSQGYVRRGVVIGDYLASISEMEVQFVDYSNRDKPEVLSSVRVANYTGQIYPCGGALCDTGNVYYDGTLRLRTFDPNNLGDEAAWESQPLDQDLGGYYWNNWFLSAGTKSYLLNNSYNYYEDENGSWHEEINTVINGFDTSDGLDPKHLGSHVIEWNQDSYWWYNGVLSMTENAVLGMSQTYWDNSDHYRYKVFTVDVSDPNNPGDVQEFDDFYPLFGYYYGFKIIANGSSFWLPTCENAGTDKNDLPILRCYALELNASNPDELTTGEKINIPGQLIGMSEDGSIMYAVDRQYLDPEDINPDDYYYNYTYTLEILKRVDGGVVRVGQYPVNEPFSYEGYWWGGYWGEEDAVESEGMPVSPRNAKGKVPEAADEGEGEGEGDDSGEGESEGEGEYDNSYSYSSTSYSIDDAYVYLKEYYYYQDSNYDWCDTDTFGWGLKIRIINAATGQQVGDVLDLPGASYSTAVNGGGIVVNKMDKASYYSYWFRPDMLYVGRDGKIVDATPETLSDSYYYGYIYGQPVRMGDDLYMSFGWDGIQKVSLK